MSNQRLSLILNNMSYRAESLALKICDSLSRAYRNAFSDSLTNSSISLQNGSQSQGHAKV